MYRQFRKGQHGWKLTKGVGVRYWMMGFATCLSLFVEEKKRRGELAMYVMPKALESAWSIARRRAYVPFSKSSSDPQLGS